MHAERPYCLSIAGFDPSGGAGILADIKTFEQNKVYGLGVVSALTVQNDVEFKSVKWLSLEEIISQLEPLEKFPVKGIKIGLIQSIDAISKLVVYLKKCWPEANVVWDPVLSASAGFKFHDVVELPSVLIDNLSLITPNLIEFKALGFDMNLPSTAVLLKGGHRTEKRGVDTLFFKNISSELNGKAFGNITEKHGTGCILSSAITAQLAFGQNLLDACIHAKKYVEKLILSNNSKLAYHNV